MWLVHTKISVYDDEGVSFRELKAVAAANCFAVLW